MCFPDLCAPQPRADGGGSAPAGSPPPAARVQRVAVVRVGLLGRPRAGVCPNLLQRRPATGSAARRSAEYQRFSSGAPARSGPLQQIWTTDPPVDCNERPELRPRWGAWDSWDVRDAPARRGSGGRRTRPPTTAPGPRGRLGRPRKGLVAQGPDRTLIGVTPPGTVLLPYSDDRKVRSHDTAVSGLPRRPVPRPRLRPQDQELP